MGVGVDRTDSYKDRRIVQKRWKMMLGVCQGVSRGKVFNIAKNIEKC